MLPTLAHGQILVTRPACGYFAKGDVVVFTTATGHLYVKRIAGMPGDLVALVRIGGMALGTLRRCPALFGGNSEVTLKRKHVRK